MTLGAITIAFTTMSVRVSAVEVKAVELTAQVDRLTDITERLVVIEQRTDHNREDIIEIKEDIKDLKRHFNLQ